MEYQLSKTKLIDLIIKILLSLLVFSFSLWLLPYYTNGDQEHYRKAYILFSDASLMDAYKLYFINLGASEPIYFLLSWSSSNIGIEKDIFIAISNALLAYVSIGLMQKWNVWLPLIVIFIFTDYYYLVLYTGAERLKFGFLFFILALSSKKYFKLLSITAVMTHFQILIFYISMFSYYIFKQSIKLFKYGKINKTFIFIIIAGIIFLLFFLTPIYNKIQYYLQNNNLDILRISFIFLLTLLYAKTKEEVVQVVLLFLPLFAIVSLIGGERVNMIGYFIFLYYALKVRRGVNIGIIVTFIYYAYSSYFFISNILQYGTGFVNG